MALPEEDFDVFDVGDWYDFDDHYDQAEAEAERDADVDEALRRLGWGLPSGGDEE